MGLKGSEYFRFRGRSCRQPVTKGLCRKFKSWPAKRLTGLVNRYIRLVWPTVYKGTGQGAIRVQSRAGNRKQWPFFINHPSPIFPYRTKGPRANSLHRSEGEKLLFPDLPPFKLIIKRRSRFDLLQYTNHFLWGVEGCWRKWDLSFIF